MPESKHLRPSSLSSHLSRAFASGDRKYDAVEQAAGAQRGGPLRLRREFRFVIQSFPLATSRSPAAWLSLSFGIFGVGVIPRFDATDSAECPLSIWLNISAIVWPSNIAFGASDSKMPHSSATLWSIVLSFILHRCRTNQSSESGGRTPRVLVAPATATSLTFTFYRTGRTPLVFRNAEFTILGHDTGQSSMTFPLTSNSK